MANTTTANLQINATQATQTLNKVQKQVDGLGKSFAGLGKVLGGLAIGTFITNMFRSADAIADLSSATGIATGDLLALQQAFILSGGKADTAEKAILKVYQSIQEAADGNQDLIESFEKVGVSLQDLGTLTEKEILFKVIKGLAAMGDSAEAVSLKMKLLTKEGRLLDLSNALEQFDKLKSSTKEAEPSIEAVAKLIDNLDKFKANFGTALAKEFAAPLNALVQLSGGTEKLAEALAALTKTITIALAVWATFYKVIPAIGSVMNGLEKVLTSAGGVFGFLTTMIAAVVGGLGRLKDGTGKISDALGNTGSASEKLAQRLFTLVGVLAAVLKGFLRFAGIAGIIYTVAEAIDIVFDKILGLGSPLEWLGEKFSYAWNKAKELFGLLVKGDRNYFKETSEGSKILADELQEVEIQSRKNIDRLEGLRKKNEEFLVGVRELTKEFNKQNNQRLMNLETELKFGAMSSDMIELEKHRLEIQQQLNETLGELNKKRAEAVRNKMDPAVIASIDTEIKKVKENAAAYTKSGQDIIKMLQARRLEQERVNLALDREKQKMEDAFNLRNLEKSLATIGLVGDELERTNMVLDVTGELQKKLLGYEQQLMDLQNRRGELGEARYQLERDHINKLKNQAYEYAGARLDVEDKIQKKQKETSESASFALKQYFNEISKNTTPAKLAVDSISVVFDSMNKSIDSFVENGKFKFKDFAQEVIKQLAAIALKAAATKLVGFLGNVFGKVLGGRAMGGPVAANTPYVVGEKGPEIFVPKSSGSIVPNNEAFGGSSNRRATGGNSGGGQVVNNYITNNISAIDAKSVAQLFAQNRKTLLGTVRMAEAEMPYMAR